MGDVAAILAPDKVQIVEHLGLLFGRAMSGRIELTAIKAGEHTSPRTHFFDVDQLEEAAAWAAETNAEHMWNVYVGAATRVQDVFPGKAARDEDFHQAWAIHADADDIHDLKAVQKTYRSRSLTPPYIVITGRTPSTRAQLWWPLEEPITDPNVYRRTLRGVAAALHTDPSVTAAKQLMRLGGSINWPKKDGRLLEKTEIVQPRNAQAAFELTQIHYAFPPLETVEGVVKPAEPSGGSLAGAMAAHDLRSALASMRADDRDLWVRMGHALKHLGDQGMGLWLEWSQTSPKYDPADAMRVWESFKPSHTGYQAVFAEAQRRGWANPAVGRPPVEDEPEADRDPTSTGIPVDLFEVLSIADLRALPDALWIIDKIIPKAGLGFIYGPPGSYKTFVCCDLGLTLAYGCPQWLDKDIKHPGSVLYIANEGAAGLKNRITAWQTKAGVVDDTDRFRLIRKSMSFMDLADVARLERTVAAEVEARGAVDTIFVDTVSRVLPGADENLQKDMTIFVAACDRLREAFGATVIGVHHTNKQGEMRGSTVFLGQGDFVMRVEKDEGRLSGILTCEKQKEAEDGWKKAFTVAEQSWTPAGRIEASSSLVVTFGGEPYEETSVGEWPVRSTCSAILKEIDAAWTKGKPWSPHARSQTEGRFAVRNISAAFSVPAKVAQDMIETWQRTETIGMDTFDQHTKQRGLRVLQWLD